MGNYHVLLFRALIWILTTLFFCSGTSFSQSNIAIGKIYDASSFYPGFPPVNAFDGNTSNTWNAGAPAPPTQWISVDLTEPFDVYSIRLTVAQFPSGSTTHKICITDDFVNWDTIESLTDNTFDQQVIFLDYSSSPKNTRGIKVMTFNSPSWVAWYEIEVFDGILPVELINFKAESTKGGVVLNWSTASEINNMGFEVQKSNNSRDWQITDFIEGQGTTNEVNIYQFQDPNPYSGISYYRLKQIDYDGAGEYSKVITVNHNNIEKEIQVFPNPSNGLINIQINNPINQSMEIRLTDNLGRLVWESELIEGESNWQEELEIKRTGIYFISAQFGDDFYYERVIITDEK